MEQPSGQPDIVIREESAPMHAEHPQPQPSPRPEPTRVNMNTFPAEQKTFTLVTFGISVLGFILLGISYFSTIEPLFLISVATAILGIILSVLAQSKKKPGEKYAFAALILSGLTLLSAIIIFIKSIVALPGA